MAACTAGQQSIKFMQIWAPRTRGEAPISNPCGQQSHSQPRPPRRHSRLPRSHLPSTHTPHQTVSLGEVGAGY